MARFEDDVALVLVGRPEEIHERHLAGLDGKDVIVATGEQQYGNGDARHHTVVRIAHGPAMPPAMSTADLNLGSDASMNGATAGPRLSPI